MKRSILLLYAILFCTQLMLLPAAAMKKVAQSKFQFLKLGSGARSIAMADAYTAMSGDPNCIFYNPAGTAFVKKLAMSFNHSQWLSGSSYQSAAISYSPRRFGTFSLNYLTMNYGTFERTIVDAHSWEGYISQGTFTVGEYAIGFGYANQITNRFFVGGQVKYAYQDLGASRVWEWIGSEFETERESKNENQVVAYDIGVYYDTEFKNLRIGMSVQNFANVPIPLNFRFGLAMDVNQVFFPAYTDHVLTVSCDVLHPRDYAERMQIGGEYCYKGFFALRGGYKVNYDQEGLTGGMGLKLAYSGMQLHFDYAATNFGVFGMIQRFSLALSF
jgi:hypothetical protein